MFILNKLNLLVSYHKRRGTRVHYHVPKIRGLLLITTKKGESIISTCLIESRRKKDKMREKEKSTI